MNKLILLAVASTFLLIKTTYAQDATHLKLSTSYPAASKKVTIIYNSDGTSVTGKSPLTAKIYYLDNKNYPVDEVTLKPDGKLWNYEITIPDSAKAFVIKVVGGDSTDNNKGKGYIYLVYKNKKPVRGAYAANGFAYILSSRLGLSRNNELALAAYEKELALYSSVDVTSANYITMLQAGAVHKPNTAAVSQKIDSLVKIGTEASLMAAVNSARSIKNNKQADSLSKVVKAKFPNGVYAGYDLQNAFFQQRGSAAQKDSVYRLFVKDHAANKEIVDIMISLVASAYLKEANFTQYNKYKSLMKDTSNISGILNDAAYGWAQFGFHNTEAERLSKESMDITSEKIKHPVSSNFQTVAEVKHSLENQLDSYADTYNLILYDEGKYAEALKLQTPIWERAGINTEINEHYAMMLVAIGEYAKAKPIIETAIKGGHSTENLKEALKKCYAHDKGSGDGFAPYFAKLDSVGKTNSPEYQAEHILNNPAPLFALKDLNGKTVSLANLKGKTVIIDFWATWCGPCKASMPGMQLAVNKYKDNPNIQFLFIDTWESSDNYLQEVKDFINDSKYSFHVLLDDKDFSGRQAKVISQYKVSGIPTKFVIDRNGVLHSKLIGYSGSDEKVLAEVSDMIEAVK